MISRRRLVLAAAGTVLVRPAVALAAEDDPDVLLRLLAREDAAAPGDLSEEEFDAGLADLLDGRLGDAPGESDGEDDPKA